MEWASGCVGFSSGEAYFLVAVVDIARGSKLSLGAVGRTQTRFAACRPAILAKDAAILIVMACKRKGAET